MRRAIKLSLKIVGAAISDALTIVGSLLLLSAVGLLIWGYAWSRPEGILWGAACLIVAIPFSVATRRLPGGLTSLYVRTVDSINEAIKKRRRPRALFYAALAAMLLSYLAGVYMTGISAVGAAKATSTILPPVVAAIVIAWALRHRKLLPSKELATKVVHLLCSTPTLLILVGLPAARLTTTPLHLLPLWEVVVCSISISALGSIILIRVSRQITEEEAP